jgi:hypothetical protein
MTVTDRMALARRATEPRFHLRVDGTDINFYGDYFCLNQLAEFYRPYYSFDRNLSENPQLRIYVTVENDDGPQVKRVHDVSDYLLPSEFELVEPGVRRSCRPVSGIEVIVAVRDRSIYLFGASKDDLMLQLRMFVRDQILQKIQEQAGSILIHASAVERDGLGIIFAGDRNAGKTSSLLAYAARGDYNIVSSDRVALRAAASEIIGSGFPARCNAHRIACETDPILSRIVPRHTLQNDSGAKVLVPLEEIAAAAGARVSGKFKLSAIVLPRIDSEFSSLAVERMTGREQLIEMLRYNELRGGANDGHVHWLNYFVISDREASANREQIADLIADEIPVYRVHASYPTYVKAIEAGVFEATLVS